MTEPPAAARPVLVLYAPADEPFGELEDARLVRKYVAVAKALAAADPSTRAGKAISQSPTTSWARSR